MIPLTYKAISLPHLSFKCFPASILQSWKNIISAEPWEERMVNQLWLLTNQMSTINYNTNQFIRLLGSSLSDQLLRNFNTEDKKSQSGTLIRILESMKHYSEWNKLSYSNSIEKQKSNAFQLCVYWYSQWIDCYEYFSIWSLSPNWRGVFLLYQTKTTYKCCLICRFSQFLV